MYPNIRIWANYFVLFHGRRVDGPPLDTDAPRNGDNANSTFTEINQKPEPTKKTKQDKDKVDPPGLFAFAAATVAAIAVATVAIATVAVAAVAAVFPPSPSIAIHRRRRSLPAPSMPAANSASSTLDRSRVEIRGSRGGGVGAAALEPLRRPSWRGRPRTRHRSHRTISHQDPNGPDIVIGSDRIRLNAAPRPRDKGRSRPI